MSIQAGICHFDQRPIDNNALLKMSRSLASLAPDGESTYLNGSLNMLYCPFHTTPESKLENQPLILASGLVMMWDGRLDNRDQLLLSLGPLRGTPPSDLAIAAAAFERWGTDCFR